MKLLQKSYQKILLLFLCAAAILVSKSYQAEGNRYLLQSSYQNEAKKDERANIIEAASYITLGDACVKEGDYDQAIRYYRKAFGKYVVIYGEQPHENIADIYAKVGKAYCYNKGYKASAYYFQQAIKMYQDEKIYGHLSHSKIANSYYNQAIAYGKAGQYVPAIAAYKQALDMYKALYGDKPYVNTADAYNNLGYAYYKYRKYDEAIAAFNKALDMYLNLYGDTPHASVANAYHNLGLVYRAQWEFSKAISYFEKATEVKKALKR